MAVVKEKYSQNKLIQKLHDHLIETKFVLKNLKNIKKVANEPSYYPELPRKTFIRRKKDLLVWLIKHKDFNIFYNTYGQDLLNNGNYNDFIPFYEFVKIRRENLRRSFEKCRSNYECILNDKYVFNKFFCSILPNSIPKIVAVINNGKLVSDNRFVNQFSKIPNGTYIIKPINSDSGKGVKKLSIENNKTILNGEETTLNDVIKNYNYAIIESCIQQHELLSKLNPTSLNTLRIVSAFNETTNILTIIGISLRIGTKNAVVDNYGQGGIGVAVNETGKLAKYGIFKKNYGTKTTTTPATNVILENYQIPFYNEAIELVEKAHRQLPYFKTIGWDVAISQTGPILIEGNPDWAIDFTQATCGPKKKILYEIYNINK